jgi:hypothetical protein
MLNLFFEVLQYVISTIIITLFIKGVVIFLCSDYVVDTINKLNELTISVPLVEMKVKTFINPNINFTDYFAFIGTFTNRDVISFKYFLKLIFNFLDWQFHYLPKQQFSVVIAIHEYDYNSNSGVLIAKPTTFTYEVGNPLSHNQLFDLIQFGDLVFKTDSLKDIIITMKIVTPIKLN